MARVILSLFLKIFGHFEPYVRVVHGQAVRFMVDCAIIVPPSNSYEPYYGSLLSSGLSHREGMSLSISKHSSDLDAKHLRVWLKFLTKT